VSTDPERRDGDTVSGVPVWMKKSELFTTSWPYAGGAPLRPQYAHGPSRDVLLDALRTALSIGDLLLQWSNAVNTTPIPS
jgi:hypothetical protein